MSVIDKARLALTQCSKCLGCNRLDDETFRGDDKCQVFKDASMDSKKDLSECSEQEDSHTENWRPYSSARGKR